MTYNRQMRCLTCDGCGSTIDDREGSWIVNPISLEDGKGKLDFCSACVRDMTYKLEGHVAQGIDDAIRS